MTGCGEIYKFPKAPGRQFRIRTLKPLILNPARSLNGLGFRVWGLGFEVPHPNTAEFPNPTERQSSSHAAQGCGGRMGHGWRRCGAGCCDESREERASVWLKAYGFRVLNANPLNFLNRKPSSRNLKPFSHHAQHLQPMGLCRTRNPLWEQVAFGLQCMDSGSGAANYSWQILLLQ